MKLLYLNPIGSLGGAERSLLDAMTAIRDAQPQWRLQLIAGTDGDLIAGVREIGAEARVLSLPGAVTRLGDAGAGNLISIVAVAARVAASGPRLIGYFKRLRRATLASQPDIIISNGFKTHILAAWAAPSGIPIVWHVRDYVRARPLMSRLMRAHARRCSVAITNSQSTAEDLAQAYNGRLKIRTVYNAIDLERFNACGAALDLDALAGAQHPDETRIRVGLLGTTARWKGHEIFLRALAMLRDDRIRGYIIGGPIYDTRGSQFTMPELQETARKLGLNGRVRFTGYVNDPAAAIRALDVVVHASTRPEPFGRVVAEAMACGKPVVTANLGGVAEVISEGENALTYPSRDAGALAERLVRLADDPDLRRRLGANGRRRAEDRFGRARLARELIAIYESAIASR
jgi:glycosyltransferase involved in cell wall biosynthesis